MKYIKSKLSRQLLLVVALTFGIILISIGFLLPNRLLPVYEDSLYNYLKQPLDLVNENINDNSISTEVGYVYIYDNQITISDNLYEVIKIKDIDEISKYIKQKSGKFIYKGNTYYYYKNNTKSVTRLAITNDSYIKNAEQNIVSCIFPIIIVTFIIVGFLLILWSTIIVRKIEKLKSKIDHIDNDDYDHHVEITDNDELESLELAIEDMRISLKNQEEYRNQMYQNISHDFKTPLTVIKSYIEAVDDGIETSSEALPIIKEQTNKLEQKVHSLLYLNKLDYIKDSKVLMLENIDLTPTLNSSIEKFKYQNKNINFKLQTDKFTSFLGTEESWETIIDNILSNFIRYAEKEIKVTVKKNQIIFYNDGPNIDNNLIDGIFIPFRKGIKGEFGLGLSIVKKTLNMLGYDINIKNHNKKGVSFIITKGLN